MKISIIIPTYNEEKYLPKLLESIKIQEFSDYEVIVADAQSNDNTRKIANEYDCIIVEGGLPGTGRNNGVKIAQGDILLFLDADLELTNNYLKNVIKEFESEGLGIAITQMTPLSQKKRDIYLHNLANWFMIAVENIKPHGAGCYGILSKKQLHEKINGFNEDLSFGEDTDYIERIAKISKFKVLRNAKIGVSTRRLEKEGFYTLLKQYGKSTINDFRGKRTSAEELEYEFGHYSRKNLLINTIDNYESECNKIEEHDRENMEKIVLKSRNRKIKDKINEFKDYKPEENELLEVKVNENETTLIGINIKNTGQLKSFKNSDIPILKNEEKNTARISLNDVITKTGRKRIFYSVCGEGMGHAIRSSVILNHLIKKYDVYIFSSERAYEFLAKKFDNVFEIGGFNTVYENNIVRTKKTFFNAMKSNFHNLKEGYNILYKEYRKVKPNIIISDFENYSSILSKIMNIPLISLDNIHMITQCEYDYPQNHRIDMLTAIAVIKSYILRPKRHIITSFFYPPLKHPHMTALHPPVLREEFLKLKSENGEHILVYQTAESSIKLIEELKKLDYEFKVYGFNKDEVDDNLTYKSFNEKQIFEDMRTAKAIILNGGFTMISEAIYLKKPIYSIPAHKNFEQILNGFYVEKLGFGESHENLNVKEIEKFLTKLDKYKENLNKIKPWNNTEILKDLDLSIEKYSILDN